MKHMQKRKYMEKTGQFLLAVDKIVYAEPVPADHAPGCFVWLEGKQEALFVKLSLEEISLAVANHCH